MLQNKELSKYLVTIVVYDHVLRAGMTSGSIPSFL
jgi:hypothetical protein